MPPATKKAAAKEPPKSLAALREAMGKKYGTGRIVKRSEVKPYTVISTGSIEVDAATVVGGVVVGRITEFAGVEGSAKTTTTINVMANAQRTDPRLVGYIDMEQNFDWDWAEANGLNTADKRFLYAFPNDAEDVSDQAEEMIRTGLFSVLVVDSIGGMESKQAFTKEAEEHVMGRNAQVITRMVKRLAVLARQHHCAVILVNQFRANFANPMAPDITAGPKALKYATSMRLDFRPVAGEGDRLMAHIPGVKEPQIVGVRIAVRVQRSKVGPQGRNGAFFLIKQVTPEYGPIGIDRATEALTLGLDTGVILVEGGGYHVLPWTTDKKDRIHGATKVKQFLRTHPDRVEQIRLAAIATYAHEVIPEVEVAFDQETGEVLDETTEVPEVAQ